MSPSAAALVLMWFGASAHGREWTLLRNNTVQGNYDLIGVTATGAWDGVDIDLGIDFYGEGPLVGLSPGLPTIPEPPGPAACMIVAMLAIRSMRRFRPSDRIAPGDERGARCYDTRSD
mgnify:FL=1